MDCKADFPTKKEGGFFLDKPGGGAPGRAVRSVALRKILPGLPYRASWPYKSCPGSNAKNANWGPMRRITTGGTLRKEHSQPWFLKGGVSTGGDAIA